MSITAQDHVSWQPPHSYVGEQVLVGGFFYEIIWFEDRNDQPRCIAYCEDLGHEIGMALEDVLAALVVESPHSPEPAAVNT